MAADIQLTFYNKSNDVNNSDILIFSQNVATDGNELAVAWLVIKNCGPGDYHPFTYPLDSTVGANDADGNYTAQQPAAPGQLFTLQQTSTGHHLALTGDATSAQEIQVVNGLQQGAIGANVYKDGRLFATRQGIAPMQKAVFAFKPTIWIGVASQVEQESVIDAAIINSVNTQISLLGIAKADIVMSGGGPGADAKPFQFTLANVVMA